MDFSLGVKHSHPQVSNWLYEGGDNANSHQMTK